MQEWYGTKFVETEIEILELIDVCERFATNWMQLIVRDCEVFQNRQMSQRGVHDFSEEIIVQTELTQIGQVVESLKGVHWKRISTHQWINRREMVVVEKEPFESIHIGKSVSSEMMNAIECEIDRA